MKSTVFVQSIILLFAGMMFSAGFCKAGQGADLNLLTTSAGQMTPPFSPAVSSYTLSHNLRELLAWPLANDVEARIEVRTNGGEWRQVSTGRTMSAGPRHLAVVMADGKVAVWGSGDEGQLNVPSGLTGVVSVACGARFTMALRANGTVAAWGSELLNEVSGPNGLTGVSAISASQSTSYAVMRDGTVRMFGNEGIPPAGSTNMVSVQSYGGSVRAQRRDGSWIGWSWNGLDPALIPSGFQSAVALTSEGNYFAGLQPDGTVKANAGREFVSPAPPPELSGVTVVESCSNGFVALKSDGTVVAWGPGEVAKVPSGLSGVTAIDAHESYAAALKSDGSVVVWGDVPELIRSVPAVLAGSPLKTATVQMLQLGANTVEVRLTPPGGSAAKTYTLNVDRTPNAGMRLLESDIGTLSPVFSPSVSTYTITLPYANDAIRLRALPFSGEATLTINGQPMPGGMVSAPLPLSPGSNTIVCTVTAEDGVTQRAVTVTAVRGAAQSNTALRSLAHMAGPLVPEFSADQLTYTHEDPVRQPVIVIWPRVAQVSAKVEVRSNNRPWQEVTTGRQFAVTGAYAAAIQPDRRVRFWYPSNLSQAVPFPPGLPACAAVTDSLDFGSALLTDGTPALWDNIGNPRPLPASVPAGQVVELASLSGHIMAALLSDGTVTAWFTYNGEVLPSPFPGLTDIVSLVSGSTSLTAVRRNGLVAKWADSETAWVPAGLTGIVAAASGFRFTVALHRDGTIRAWGDNANCAASAGLNNVVAVAADAGTAMALRADGSVTAWGGNSQAALDFFSSVSGVSQISGSGALLYQHGGKITGPGMPPPAAPADLIVRDLPSSPAVPLDPGLNDVQVRVTAENGTERTYHLSLTRVLNTDLRSLGVSPGGVQPAFSPGASRYRVDIPFTQTTLELAPLADDSTSLVRIDGTVVPAGGKYTVSLVPGLNTFTLTIVAEDDVSVRTIVIEVMRAPANASLRSLAAGIGILAPEPEEWTRQVKLPALSIWPRPATAGAVLEWRTATESWQRMETGTVAVSTEDIPHNATILRADGTVATSLYPAPAGLRGVSLAAGNAHAAVLQADGTVVTIGDLDGGRLRAPAWLTNACAVAATGKTTLAVRTDGSVAAWGDPATGLLAVPPDLMDAVAVHAAGNLAVAVRRGGGLAVWGGSLVAPVPGPPQLTGVVQAVVSENLILALLNTGHVWQWNPADGIRRSRPELAGAVSLSSGMVLRANGEIVSLKGYSFSPPFTGVVALHGHFALRADGTLWRLLYPDSGMASTEYTLPVRPAHLRLPLEQGTNRISFRVYADGLVREQSLTLEREPHTALRFLATGGGALTPGFSREQTAYTQTVSAPQTTVWANAVNPAAAVEVRVNGGAWTRLGSEPRFASNRGFLGIGTDGKVVGWPLLHEAAVSILNSSTNWHALLDDGLPVAEKIQGTGVAAPTLDIPPLPGRLSTLSASSSRAAAVLQDGTFYQWGGGSSGPGPARAVQGAAGSSHTLALLEDGTVHAQGGTAGGEGLVPAGLDGVVAVAAGDYHSLALRFDGTVVAWGNNNAGQCSVPDSLRDVIAIAAAGSYSVALNRRGEVRQWGGISAANMTITGPLNAKAIMAGEGWAGALTPGGGAVVWGPQPAPPPLQFATTVLSPAIVLPLHLGTNTVDVRVTEPDGTAVGISTVAITRLSTAALASLSAPGMVLSPPFSSDTAAYTAGVPHGISTLRLEALTAESGATVRVNGVAGGTAVQLQPGENVIQITVTAEDGLASRSYTVTVTRGSAAAPSLRLLSTAGAVDPLFSPLQKDYVMPDQSLPAFPLHVLPGDPRSALRVRLNSQAVQELTAGHRISGGLGYNIAIKPDGTVAAWGNPRYGILSIPAGLADVVSLSGGDSHAAALRRDGTVVAWGKNDDGECDVPSGLHSVVEIAVGGNKTMALREDGSVVVWGTAYNGETTPPTGLGNVVDIAAGYTHCAALRRDGTIVQWGAPGVTLVPAGLPPAVAVGAGREYTSALLADGTVRSWGFSIEPYAAGAAIAVMSWQGGAAIRRDGTLALSGVAAPALSGLTDLWGYWGSSGRNSRYGLAIRDDGSLVTWSTGGTPPQPPAGFVAKTGRAFPMVELAPGPNTIEVQSAADDGLTKANYRIAVTRLSNPLLASLTLSGAALSPSFSPQTLDYTAAFPASISSVLVNAFLDDNTSVMRINGTAVPSGHAFSVPVLAGLNVITLSITAEDGVATATYRIVATRAAGNSNARLRSLGSSDASLITGFLPETTSYQINGFASPLILWPRAESAGTKMDFQLSAGGWSPLSNGAPVIGGSSLFTLALHEDGTVRAWGSNTAGQTAVPAGLSGVVSVAAGNAFSLALRGDGGVQAWGENTSGQTGVPASLEAVAIAAGRNHALALTKEGAVAAWGRNEENQCSVPAGLTGVAEIAGGYTHSAAVTRDGRVFTWGAMAQSTVPAGLPPVVSVAAGDSFTAVLKHDGTVTAWGNNTFGQTTIPASLENVTAIACGGRHVLALKRDGTVAAWGDNLFGQRTVPAGLTNVVSVSAGGSLSMAVLRSGTLVIWGTNNGGQLSIPPGLLCPAGTSFTATALPPGTSTLQFRLTAADGISQQTYTINARSSYLPAYMQWATGVFPAGTSADRTMAAADPDADGLLNGLEYLLATDPLVPTISPLQAEEEGGFFTFSFPRRAGVPDGLETIEVSGMTDSGWQTVPPGNVVRLPGAGGQPDIVTVRLPLTGGRIFVRVKCLF